jgi:membrane-bound lytic murein transglycosylase A
MRSKILLCLLIIISSCARAPLTNIKDSMRPASTPPVFLDTLSSESFFIALREHVNVMKTSRQVMDPMIFGEKKIAKKDYIASLEAIFDHQADWVNWIGSNFDFYEVYGQQDWGEVMSTGYYEPKVAGSTKPTPIFSQPLYASPDDMITIDLKTFAHKFPKGEKLGFVQGRLNNQIVTAYYDRKEIDVDQKLKNKNLELAWLDPIDAFFIQIQGTGLVEFENGETIRFGYANQNGHPYLPIGRFLTDHIPLEEMSMQRIRLHLKTLPMPEQQKILNMNPSYVFFKKLEGGALTYAGMEVTAGRTIATDLQLFPKGAMAFLDIEEPVFNSATDVHPASWEKKPRVVFDEDTGGAIRGGGRVDLYFGEGDVAAQKAGVMKQKGRLYYLVPRS